MGKLIVIEGLDGCGKTTQLERLKKTFADFRFLTFPNYASPCGGMISEYLAGELPEPDPTVGAYAVSTLYAMDRYMSFRKDWSADYAAGRPILSARYATSNAIYQMTKLPKEQWDAYLAWLMDLEYGKFGLPKPDLVLYRDVPVAVSQRLLSERYQGDEHKKDIHEANIAYLGACREAAMYVKSRGLEPWQVIDCTENEQMRPVEDISAELTELVQRVSNEEKRNT